jgi:hypothetical protein
MFMSYMFWATQGHLQATHFNEHRSDTSLQHDAEIYSSR